MSAFLDQLQEEPGAPRPGTIPPPGTPSATVPTLGVIAGPPAVASPSPPPAQGASQEAAAGPQASPPQVAAQPQAPSREVAQQGSQPAPVLPRFKLPPVEEMVADYQRWQMMASDPAVAKAVAPRMQAWRNLTMQQHAKEFKGDPTASPEMAASYARHMGKIQGELGQPMPWEEAAKIAEYTQGQKSKMPLNFMDGMARYDKSAVQPFIDDIFGAGWKLQSLAPGRANIGGNEMDIPTITIVGPNGETKTHNSLEISTLFGHYEGAVKVAELNRKREIEAAQAELDLARANNDPTAAATAFEKLATLKGSFGNVGPGKSASDQSLSHMPTINAALKQTGSSLDPLFVLAVVNAESRGNPNARSPKNAQGVMQLIPETAKRFGVSDPYNAEQNILGGVKYLNFLNDRYNGDLQKIAAAYNAGEGRVDEYGGVPPFKETRQYVKDVIGTYKRHKGEGEPNTQTLGERLVRMPLGSTSETRAYTPGSVSNQEKVRAAYAKARSAIVAKELGAKEEARQLEALDQTYRDQFPGLFAEGSVASANPPGMPTQPPGGARATPAAPAPAPAPTPARAPAAPAGGGPRAKSDEELKAMIQAAVG